ncbi:MAG TPA: metalloregulator ArsR/SmtB family transcription factor [Steroidobacteraceae bacterium]|nr:metalloregulator ArsR/SmtB family transcription factor [Steroidobacteraceae bacterium]
MDAFGAIADPIRRGILDLLGPGPRAAGEIAARFEVTPSAISQHLRYLRYARLIQVRAQAQRRIYSIDPRGFQDLQRWLNRYRAFWEIKLDALEAALLEGERSRSPKAPGKSATSRRARAPGARPRKVQHER